MKILSIETSCDDTCLTLFEAKGGIQDASFKILANNSNSQIKTHIPYGGVYPMLAKREHTKNLPILLEKTLKEANLTPAPLLNKERSLGRGIDLICVTYGPGLEPSLWTGIVFAKELANKWKVPLIPVNHMEGHVVSVFGKDKGKFTIPKLKSPILSLLVSGGHTQLVLSKKPARTIVRSGGWMNYEIIGETLDDAVGEAFDKVARMMDLPYPGGPQISKLAEERRNLPESGQISAFKLPRPMLHSRDFNFSFSGLKTAVLYLIKKIGPLNDKLRSQIALEFENAAIECLVYKTAKAIEKYKVKTMIVAGGVAANKHLRTELRKVVRQGLTTKHIKLLFPTMELATDNSVMIGIAGYLNYLKNKKKVPELASIKATGNLRL